MVSLQNNTPGSYNEKLTNDHFIGKNDLKISNATVISLHPQRNSRETYADDSGQLQIKAIWFFISSSDRGGHNCAGSTVTKELT